MKDLLVLDDLCKSFPIDLLNPVSFSLKNISASFSKGSCSAFLGHNGAGKTSTIKIILGLLKADQGRVLFKGQEMSRQDRALLGYMPETSRLSMEMTPWEHVRMQLGLYSAYGKDLSLKQATLNVLNDLINEFRTSFRRPEMTSKTVLSGLKPSYFWQVWCPKCTPRR